MPLDGVMTLGEVLLSRADAFAPGDLVWHALGWRELAIVDAGVPALGGLGTLTRLEPIAAPQHYLGPLGGMGLTAWFGLTDAGELRDGDIVWVSAAAGAVGSLAAQFAKLLGHRVIGSAGSAEKVAYLRDELGLDVAFDRAGGDISGLLAAAAPGGIDVYFDNVGGDHLEAALNHLRAHGRVAVCGSVGEYELSEPVGPRNLFQLTAKSLTLRGFRGSAYSSRINEMKDRVGAWLADGSLVYRETVVEGLARAPEALAAMLAGRTIGKTVVRIA
jgi:NADPH-dependent curcumin reductase CurA